MVFLDNVFILFLSFPLGSSFVYNYEATFSASSIADGSPSVDGNLKATIGVEVVWGDKAESLLKLTVSLN